MTGAQQKALGEICRSPYWTVKKVIETTLPPARVIVYTDDYNEAQIHEDGRTYWAWSDPIGAL